MSRLAQLRQMLAEEPADAFLRYAISVELAAQGNRTEAIENVQQLIADRPDYLGAYYQLGQWLEQEGKPNEALHIYHLGAELARKTGNKKTLGEINEAIWLLED
jgi:tetratricopeptide (TPR) repeat protein